VGKAYDPGVYEGTVFLAGDGTVQEFVSGLLTRRDWRLLVR
jgi:diacylglycerol kinase family enzyme